MDALKIEGGAQLSGTIHVSGSKNASLPIMAAALLAEGESVLTGVPDLADVRTLGQVLEHMGARVHHERDGFHCDATELPRQEAPYELVRTMRASILVLGPLLTRFGRAKVSLPGGCAIGARPIDQHLKGLERLGASIEIEHGYVVAAAPRGLRGAEVVFDMPTVTGTENLMLAAVLADGTTELRNAAKEPEVDDLAKALISMGAEIEGGGTDHITIRGGRPLKPYRHRVVADRIECGTFLVAGALAGAPLTVKGCIGEHQAALVDKLRAIGARIEGDGDTLRVHRAE
ncbi:MAG TPA: UDP-N-acetylglucosamine 1-carboxyvinyltransferase, partial [Myxococcota bacterium]|nr:UDP-N-acetylglucosamine 1-carboxyvinyltransferase [Myxococcota bacterium]